MSDATEPRERLFKARRLLLATSVVLLAHYALGIQIESDAETLGLKFKFADVQKLWFGVWVVWTWALVTYLQYCHELKLDDFPGDYFERADPAQENRCREPGILIALNEVLGVQPLALADRSG